jgi:hypothetical protein
MAPPHTPATKLVKNAGLCEKYCPIFKEHGISSDKLRYVAWEGWTKDLKVRVVS